MTTTLTPRHARGARAARSGLRLAVLAAAMAAALPATAQTKARAPAAAPSTAPQDARVSELERLLKDSQARIDALTRRLESMEARGLPAAAPAPAPVATPTPAAVATPQPAQAAAQTEELRTRIDSLQQEITALANKPEPDNGVPLRGFADVGGGTGSAGRPRGASVGLVDFYLAPKFGDRIRSLIEIALEVNQAGEVGVDVERLQIGYQFSDALTAWGGRFHTPYGYWNTAFHHGAQIQTSIMRPRFLEFEDKGGILPAHAVGAWLTGTLPAGGGRLGYDAYVANGPRLASDDPGLLGTATLNPNLNAATGRAPLVGGTVRYTFGGALSGLTVGAHALTTKVDDDLTAGANRTQVRMGGLFATYLENDWEVIGETYAFRNRNLSGGGDTHSSNAGFVQVGRSFGNWLPFGRIERTTLDQGDAYFAAQLYGQSYKRWALGVRYDINPKTALKFETLRTELTDRAVDRYNEIRAQLAVRF